MVDVGDKETTRRNARAGAIIRMNSATREQVTSDLFAHELGVWLVFVEGVNDVVAILVGFRNREVRGVTGRVCIAHNIQPVTSPALTIVPG